jgi:hypothetical protein
MLAILCVVARLVSLGSSTPNSSARQVIDICTIGICIMKDALTYSMEYMSTVAADSN